MGQPTLLHLVQSPNLQIIPTIVPSAFSLNDNSVISSQTDRNKHFDYSIQPLMNLLQCQSLNSLLLHSKTFAREDFQNPIPQDKLESMPEISSFIPEAYRQACQINEGKSDE